MEDPLEIPSEHRYLRRGDARNGHPVIVPAAWQNGRDVMERLHYTLPSRLLVQVAQHVGQDRFDPTEWRRERALAESADMGHCIVGFDHGAPVSYRLLVPPQPAGFDPENMTAAANASGIPEHQYRAAIECFSVLDRVDEQSTAYLGWLMTQPQFLDEHDQLFRDHRDELARFSFPGERPFWCPRIESSSIRETTEGITAGNGDPQQITPESWMTACTAFLTRWRLETLTRPNLPVPPPLQVLGPALSEAVVGATGRVIVSIPEILPREGRGLLPELMEDAADRSRTAPHLQEWFEIISRDNPARNMLPAWARRFRLQHYWRLLHQRFPDALQQRKRRLTTAVSEFFIVSEDTLRADLRTIRRRLGDDWPTRPLDLTTADPAGG